MYQDFWLIQLKVKKNIDSQFAKCEPLLRTCEPEEKFLQNTFKKLLTHFTQRSISIPPWKRKKTKVLRRFQRVQEWNVGLKWVKQNLCYITGVIIDIVAVSTYQPQIF